MKNIFLLSVLCGFISGFTAEKLLSLGDSPLYHGGFYQGDMAGYYPDDRSAIVDVRKLWPGGVLFYELDPSVEGIRDYILDGMKQYEDRTCITFKKRTADTKDYVKISWKNGCWSAVGRTGGEQLMSLGTGCHWRGLVLHELGHALGFHHEQQRSDRDDYIEIIWGNIEKGMEQWFEKMKPYEINLLDETFDYNSVMLYDQTAFSKDGEAVTIKPTTPGVTLVPVWQKPGLSPSDVRRVNKLYECYGNVRPVPPKAPPQICDFLADDCGYVNQENMGSNFNRRDATVGGRTSTMLIMQREDVEDNSFAGRLISPNFRNLGHDESCLSFDYFMDGPGANYMLVSLQGHQTYDVGHFDQKSPVWRRFQRTINYSENDPRMLIVAVHGGSRSSFTFAVDNVEFDLNPC